MATKHYTRRDKLCEECGIIMKNVMPQRRLCSDCMKKHRKRAPVTHHVAFRRGPNSFEKKKKSEPIRPPKPDEACKGCQYWRGSTPGFYCCNYIFDEGHSRGCPPGKDCTKRK